MCRGFESHPCHHLLPSVELVQAAVEGPPVRALEWVCDGGRVPYPTHRAGPCHAHPARRLYLPRGQRRCDLCGEGGLAQEPRALLFRLAAPPGAEEAPPGGEERRAGAFR